MLKGLELPDGVTPGLKGHSRGESHRMHDYA